jgi:integrase
MGKRRATGEGTVYWSERYQRWVGQLTFPGGKKGTKFGKSQAEVKKWLLEKRKGIQDGAYVPDERYTIERFLRRYWEDIAQSSLSPRTLLSYQYLIANHINPTIGSIKLTSLRVDHLQKLYTDKLNSGLSRRTVQYIHQFLHMVLNYAVKWGLVIRNVADLAQAPAQENEPVEVLSASQAKAFLEQVRDDRLYALYACAISLGLREGELLALDWSAVDWINRTITINKQLQYLPGRGLVVKTPKTKQSRRVLPLPEVAYQALDEERKVSRSEKVFATSRGTYYYPRNLLRHFHATLRKMGLPRMPFHNLRHTCASFHLLVGTNPKIVSEILGHSSVAITLSTYSHLLPGVAEEATKKIDYLFS